MNKTVLRLSPFLVHCVKIPFSRTLFVFLIMQVSHPIVTVGLIPAFNTAFELLRRLVVLFLLYFVHPRISLIDINGISYVEGREAHGYNV